MLLPVASVTDSACATIEAASANSPANRCTPARVLKAMGSAISAPASRASVTWRSDSTSQLAWSHTIAAAWQASQSQRSSSSVETSVPRKALTAWRSTGAPAG